MKKCVIALSRQSGSKWMFLRILKVCKQSPSHWKLKKQYFCMKRHGCNSKQKTFWAEDEMLEYLLNSLDWLEVSMASQDLHNIINFFNYFNPRRSDNFIVFRNSWSYFFMIFLEASEIFLSFFWLHLLEKETNRSEIHIEGLRGWIIDNINIYQVASWELIE